MRNIMIGAAALAASAIALPASAAPFAPANPAVDAASGVVQAQYRRDCVWTGTGWGYRQGGRVLVCRPNRPAGPGWYWYSQGGRSGWYHKKYHWHHRW